MSERWIEALGWMHAEACTTLDRGEDPRDTHVPELLERARRDLDRVPERWGREEEESGQ